MDYFLMRRYAYIIGLWSVFVGCTSHELEPASYVRWVEDATHGLHVTKRVDDIEYVLQYRPVDYVALQELRRAPNRSQQALDSVRNEVKALQYFSLRIIVPKGQTDVLNYNLPQPDGFYERLAYCTSEMQNDIYLDDGAVRRPCRLMHFERHYKLSPHADFLLAFDAVEPDVSSDKTLIFDDHLFQNGLIKITIEKSDLAAVPELKLP